MMFNWKTASLGVTLLVVGSFLTAFTDPPINYIGGLLLLLSLVFVLGSALDLGTNKAITCLKKWENKSNSRHEKAMRQLVSRISRPLTGWVALILLAVLWIYMCLPGHNGFVVLALVLVTGLFCGLTFFTYY